MRRGLALATILMVAAVAFIAAFTMAALSTASLNFAQHYTGTRDAQYLAEAAIARAIYQVRDDATFGTHPGDVVTVQPDPADNRRLATVTFDAASGQPYSSNNLAGDHDVGWQNSIIPPSSCRIVATATSRGTTATVDALVTAPEFPYVVASDGPLNSTGSLVVTGASAMGAVGGTSPPQRASLGCNGSVNVSQAQVSGDVVASGSVSLGAGSTVGGTVRNASITMPKIDVAPFDPTGKAGATLVDGTSNFSAVTGQIYTNGDLITPSDVVLAGGLLYVKGTLTINGALKGIGTVIVTGTTTMTNGADLSASSLVALASLGNITLSSSSSSPKYFQGLLYTQGSLSASNITIAGTLIAGGGGSGGGMTLNNVTAVGVPAANHFKSTIPAQPNPGLVGGSGLGYGQATNPTVRIPFAPPASALYASTLALYTSNAKGAYPYANAPFWIGLSGTDGGGDGNLGFVVARNDGFGSIFTLGVTATALNAQSGLYEVANVTNVKVIVPNTSAQPNVFAGNGYPNPDGSALVTFYGQAPGQGSMDGRFFSSTGQANQFLKDNQIQTTVEDMLNFALDFQQSYATLANQQISSGLPATTTTVDLSLNRFLRDTTPFRIVSWKIR